MQQDLQRSFESRLQPAFLFGALVLFISCKHSSGGESTWAVPAGRYNVSEVLCGSSSAAPNYLDANRKATLYQFFEPSLHTWDVSTSGLVETIASEECTLTISQRLSRNDSGLVDVLQFREYTWSPEDCSLPVSHGGTTYEYDSGADVFENNTSTALEMSYTVESSEDSFQLESLNEDPYNTYWETFGCSLPDTITFTLTKAE